MAYLQPGENVRSATVTAETDISVLKLKSVSVKQASVELQSCFDKAFIKLLVGRLIATNEQLAEWELVAAPGPAGAEDCRRAGQ